jgi:outer membrane protein W
MELKKGNLSLILLVVTTMAWGQNQVSDSVNRRLEVKNQLGVQFGGPSLLSLNYEHFFNHNWSVEVGVGSVLVISGVHVGGRYYFGSKAKPTKFSPYLGAAIGAAFIIGGGSSGGIGGYGTAVGYVPLGIQLMTKNGFAVSLEAAGMYLDNEVLPMGALRLYSSLKKEKKKRN